MKKLIAGSALVLISLFMLLGSFTTAGRVSGPAFVMVFLITVLLPALGGGYLLYSHWRDKNRLQQSKSALSDATLEAEILRLAGTQEGKLTALEVAREFVLELPEAERILDAMALKKLADYEITDSGLIVYHFVELNQLHEKSQSKGLLDA